MSPNNPYSSVSNFTWSMELSQDPKVSRRYYSVSEMGTVLCGGPSCYSMCLFFFVSSVIHKIIRLDRRCLETRSCVLSVWAGWWQGCHCLPAPPLWADDSTAPFNSAPSFSRSSAWEEGSQLAWLQKQTTPICTVLLTVHVHQKKHWLRAEHHSSAD